MKKLTSALLAVLLMVGLGIPAAARTVPQYWRVTARAHVLSNRADALVVYLDNPGQFHEVMQDEQSRILSLPLTVDTEYADQYGDSITQPEILPGQKISVAFQYTYGQQGAQQEVIPRVCHRVQLRQAKRSVILKAEDSVKDFDRNHAVGTITDIDAARDQVSLYIEYVSGDNVEQLAPKTGFHTIKIDRLAAVYNDRAVKTPWQDLAPFQRVVFSGDWLGADFSVQGGKTIDYMRVIDARRQLFTPEELADLYAINETPQ